MNRINVELIDKGQLTKREGEVLKEVCAGRSDKEIARLLGCSIRTVACHIDHIYEKLEIKGQSINTRCTAIAMAVARGMVRYSLKALFLAVAIHVAQIDRDAARLSSRISGRGRQLRPVVFKKRGRFVLA